MTIRNLYGYYKILIPFLPSVFFLDDVVLGSSATLCNSPLSVPLLKSVLVCVPKPCLYFARENSIVVREENT